ncbi:MAG TPA: hypothetical protein DCQ98_14220 [Planctomycetaceae bacterium]|nr:hypothetical protein [Planctomycetaceae bacterium]HRF00629.1 hypothetical protein [Pirellulaceae bacterium]
MPDDLRSTSDIRYFVRRRGKESGPHARGKIERALADGRLDADDEFRRADHDSWRSLADWPPVDRGTDKAQAAGVRGTSRPLPTPPPVQNRSSTPVSFAEPPRVGEGRQAKAETRKPSVRTASGVTPLNVALLGTIGLLLLVIGILIGRLSDTERTDRTPDPDELASARPVERIQTREAGSALTDRALSPASETTALSPTDRGANESSSERDNEVATTPIDGSSDDRPLTDAAMTDSRDDSTETNSTHDTDEAAPIDAPLPPVAPASPRGEPTTLHQSVQFQRMPRYVVLDNPLIQELHYLIESELKVFPPDVDGYREIEQVVREARVLNADELSRASLERALAKLVGWQFGYRINRYGEVIDWRSGPRGELESDSFTVDGNPAAMVTTVLDEDGWKELATLTFFRPPDGEQANRPFERQMTHDFGPLGRWWGMTTFAPRGRDGTLRRFEYRHAMTYEAPEAESSTGLPFEIVAARLTPRLAEGQIDYDTAKEQVREVVERFEVHGEVTARMLGNSFPMEFVEPQTIIIQIDDRKRE